MDAQNKVPILLDTDIGSDIDDAVCLSYLLRQSRCELLGITTVSGEPEKRAMLADAICRVEGRPDIPIHAGTGDPLWGKQKQPQAQQGVVLDNWDHRRDFQSNTAVDFLRKTIRSRPHEITLLTIGPLTNMALLFRMDPEIPKLLKGMVMMIGAFTYPLEFVRIPVEWNSYLDPWAAAIVYDSIKEIPNFSIGLDVTEKCTMEAEECRKRLKGGALDLVMEAAEVWFEYSDKITFHDPLAGAAIFNHELISYDDGLVQVETTSPILTGMTIWDTKPEEAVHKVGTKVDSEGFFQEFFSVVQ